MRVKRTNIGVCNECGENIIIGEKYATLDGYKYHKECLEEITVDEWLAFLGEKLTEAQEEFPEWDD